MDDKHEGEPVRALDRDDAIDDDGDDIDDDNIGDDELEIYEETAADGVSAIRVRYQPRRQQHDEAPVSGPIRPPWPDRPSLRALTDELTEVKKFKGKLTDHIGEWITSLRDRVDHLQAERELRRFRPALDIVREISDPNVQARRICRIECERRAYREAERQALTGREFDLEMADDAPGIAAHVSRVGGADMIGTLRETASQITRDAVRDYPDLDGQLDLHAQLKAGVKLVENPMSLWSALAVDPPIAPPTERELRELKARALTRQSEHDRYVTALVAGMNSDADAVLAAELEAAIRRYLAVVAWQVWQEAVEQAAEKTRAAVEHRRSRVRRLAEGLRVGEQGGWSIVDIARLLLASTSDWTRPPCPLLVDKYGADHDDVSEEEKLIEVLRKDLADAKPKTRAGSRA